MTSSSASSTNKDITGEVEKATGVVEYSIPHVSNTKLVLFSIGAFVAVFIASFQVIVPASFFVQATNKWGAGVSSLWMLAAYLIGYVSFILPAMRLSEIIGRLATFWFGVVVFVVFTGVAGDASTMRTFDILRAFQGLGASFMTSVSFLTAITHVSPRNRPLLTYALGTASIFGLGVAQIIGGKLAMDEKFIWGIWLAAPITALPAILCTPALIADKKPPHAEPVGKALANFDYIGTILLTGTVTMLTLGTTFGGNEHKWNSATVICLLVFGVVLKLIFLIWERRFAKNPILNVNWLHQRNTAISIISTVLSAMPYYSLPIYVGIMYITVRQQTTDMAGRHFAPFWGTALGGGLLAGVVLRFKPKLARSFVWAGFLVGTVFGGLLYTFNVEENKAKDQAILAITGLSVAVACPGLSYMAQISVPFEEAAPVATTIHFLSIVGGMLGQILYQADLKSRLISNLDEIFSTNSFLTAFNIRTMDIAALEASAPLMAEFVGHDVAEEIAGNMIAALRTCFIVTVPFLAVPFVASLLYKKVQSEH